MFSLAATSGSPAQQVLAYARDGAGTNTACFEDRTTGICWDLAACAVSSTLGDAPWRCDAALGSPGGGMCGAAAGDDYKKRPECYVWGAAVEPPAGSWDEVWNANGSFVTAGVQPGDVLQFDNYTASCGVRLWEGTAGGPHTAVIILVGNKTLAVCHQHWNDETDDMCGYTFFRWSERCDEPWSYHYDDLKIYRPGPSATGGGERCGHCRDVVDRIVESGGVVGTS
ncbi:hypothetical protein EMIHUDRAFT_218004 [Emiliania huxleyi CCMP1516]|uniref:Uncharacterized protein n=2 Tax=Emiliania huxleyi TaxID=2903 RepID=A0A0D3I9P0_EMIH1|nr:hypothetical protein EMIHUDRAFT_218004 [Emiliania huxleyi CCMP1516]EOD07975.1 hypothetical protein EMIHUDRAFT_218004 [Emiliania huxleyi CCMP1516]|eukprot:XP_005760404.1 hypothetical protein EMIHUDRAFT_218004 [Emiliania huxleyi CCMP1516]